jgi:hypothetical protein
MKFFKSKNTTMKIFISFFLMLTGFTPLQSYCQGFENDFRSLITDSKNVWDEEDLEMCSRELESLSDEIEDYIDDEELSEQESRHLESLQNEVEVYSEFVSSFLLGRSFSMPLREFIRCNTQIGGNIYVIDESKCINVHLFELNGFEVILGWNEVETNGFDVVCQYSLGQYRSRQFTGIVEKSSCRAMSDNREEQKGLNWSINSIRCKEYRSPWD